MKMPTWGWYAVGVVVIVGVLYWLSKQSVTGAGNPQASATTPDTQPYNQLSESLSTLLGAQAQDLSHLQSNNTGSSTGTSPGSSAATISGPSPNINPFTSRMYSAIPYHA